MNMQYGVKILADWNHPDNEAAVLEWTPFLVNSLRRRTKDIFLIEDAVHETLVKVMRRIDTYHGHPDKGKAWVHQIAVNHLNDLFRKKGLVISDDTFGPIGPEEGSEENRDNLEDEERRESMDILLNCQKRYQLRKKCSFHLSKKEREVLLLALNSGYDNKTIADLMGMDGKEIKNIRDYSIKKAKKCIENQWKTKKCILYKKFATCKKSCQHVLGKNLNACRKAREKEQVPCALENK